MIAIEKAYQLRAIGGKEVYDQLDKIHKKFTDIKNVKKSLNDQMANVKDTDEYKALAEQLKNVQKEYRNVQRELKGVQAQVAELKNLQKQADAEAKRSAQTTVANAKAATEAAKAATEAQKQATQQTIQALNAEKQAAAQAHAQLKQLQLQKAQARAAVPDSAAGSYNDIAARYKQALSNYKATVSLQDAAALKLAQEHLMSLKTQLDSFNRSLTEDKVLIGEYTSGIMNAFKKMGLGHLIQDQVNTAKASLNTLNVEFNQLKHQLEQIKATGVGSLDAVERQLIENRNAAMQLESQLEQVHNEMRNMGGIGTQVTQALSNEFKNLKQSVAQFIIGYAGFQSIISGIRSSVHINYELSDTFADIKNRIHGTDEEVNTLIESLRKLDTRSSLASLVDIAAIVSKKGVAKDEIAGITQAIDNLMVSLNGEMGDAKETVSTLVKLVNVYSEDKHVTAENINAIGGAIAKLSTSGVATGAFLVDFAERLAGIRGVTGITIDKVLGLGAALEELGQRSEVSSTALSQIVVKLFTDTEKYARIAGMSVEHYKMMLKDDVLGMFVTIAQALKGNMGELEAFFENATDMHLRGARAISTIGDIAGNIDYARKRMTDATNAMRQHGIVADMAATKQQNLAANVDRLKKAWEMLASSKGVQETLTAVINLLRVAIDNLGLISIALLVFNARLIMNRAQMLLNIASTQAYTIGMGLLNAQAALATTTFSALWATMATNPLTMVIGLFGLLYASVEHFSASVRGTTDALSEKTKAMKASMDVSVRAMGLMSEEISKAKILTQTLLSTATAYDSKKAALEELKAMYPQHFKNMEVEVLKANEVAKAYQGVEKQLRANAELRAAQELTKEKQQESDAIMKLRKKIEMGVMTQQGASVSMTGFSEDEKKMLEQAAKNVYKKFKGSKADITLPSWLTQDGLISGDQYLLMNKDAYGPLAAELDSMLAKKNKEVDAYAAKAIKPVAKGGFDDTNGMKRSDAEALIRLNRKFRSSFNPGSKEYSKYTKIINANIKRWTDAGGRKPDAIQKDIDDVTKALSEATDFRTIESLDVLREQLHGELANSLDILDIKHKKGRTGGKNPDFTTEMVTASVDTEKERSKAAQADIRTEMNRQQAIYENEYESLYKRIGAYSQYVALHGKLQDEQNRSEVQRVQIKLDKIAELEAKDKKKLTKEEKNLLIQKEGLTAEMAAIKANIQTQQEATAREVEKTYGNILVDGLGRSLEAASIEIDAALQESYDRAAAMRKKIMNSGASPFMKDRMLGDLGRDVAIETDKIKLAGNDRETQVTEAALQTIQQNKQNQHYKYLLGAEIAYQQKLIALKKQKSELESQFADDKYEKDMVEAERQQEVYDVIRDGAINSFQQISAAYMQMEQQRADIDMQRQQRAMDWNRRQNEAQAQSLQEKQANEAAYQQAQEQMERRRLQKNRELAIAQMTIDYGVGVMKIWSAKALVTPVAIAETAVLSGVYFAKLAMLSAQKFEQGGLLGSGGVFGGQSHANGGSKFMWGGSMMEAERDELAIINKRSAASNRPMTVSGTPRQIASRVNAVGGGVDFAPGATSWSGRGIGWMAEYSQVPSFIAGHYMRKGGMYGGSSSDGSNADVLQSILALKDHVHNIQVQLNPHEVAGYNAEYRKSVNVGTI